jgi:putative tricarboxylic transport membrane protein
MTIRRAHLLAASFSLFIGCLFMAYSIPIYESTIGGGGGPGAGAFPFWIGLVTTFWGVMYLRQAFQNRDRQDFITREPRQRAVLLKTAVSILVYLTLMPYLGFLLTSFLLLLYYLRGIGGYRLRFALPFALAGTAVITYCFQVLLYISLPRGLIGW